MHDKFLLTNYTLLTMVLQFEIILHNQQLYCTQKPLNFSHVHAFTLIFTIIDQWVFLLLPLTHGSIVCNQYLRDFTKT